MGPRKHRQQTGLRMGVFAALAACTGDLPPGFGGGDELVHDPSRLFVRDGELQLLGSGADGAALRRYAVSLQARMATPIGVVGADPLAGGWWRRAQPWNPTGEFDAPAVSPDGRRLTFTVFDEDLGRIQDAIGLAEWGGTSWEPQGIVLSSEGEGPDTPRAMDSSFVVGDDRLHLVFGSHAGGIYLTELDPETGLLIDDPDEPSTAVAPERFTRIADNPAPEGAPDAGIEAPFLHERGGRYTLFVNVGACCRGLDSTYAVRMGQAESVEGPYLDRDGRPMLDGGGTPFLDDDGALIGPGHVGIATVEGREVVSVHVYDGDDNGVSKLVVRELSWDDAGWPVAGEVLVGP